MPRPFEVKFDHDRELSALATWWKAMLLTPAWGFLPIMPLGAFANIVAPTWSTPIFFGVIAMAIFYFWRDLHRRYVEIGAGKLYFGLGAHDLSNLKRIKLGYSHFRLPETLKFDFVEGNRKTTVTLTLAAMSWQDIDSMIELLGRRVSGLHIDEEVEAMLRSHKPLVVARINDPEHLEMNFHSRNLLKDLPGVLATTIYEWSRSVGPVGTFILFTPVWLIFNFTMFNLLRDYSKVSANREFYEELVKFLNLYGDVATNSLRFFSSFLDWFASFPMAGVLIAISAGLLFYYTVLKNLLSANRLIVNREEISLDMWTHLWSVNAASVKWKDVDKVSLEAAGGSADPNKWQVIIKDKRDNFVAIPVSAIEVNDRQNLARAFERFAPQASVSAEVTEALAPVQDKNHSSYTELWLQSLSSSSRVNLEPLTTGHALARGRYEIVETLAVGGEGVAYIAHDLSDIENGTVSEVVLKETLIPPYVDKEVQQQSVERFEREATLLKELKSDHIVGLNDYFIEEKRCYLVLEYVKGQSLRQLIESTGALASDRVLDLARQMADMLEFLHGRQIIHRDFTPDNLILQENGSLKLIDFNVARQWDKDDGKTGTIVGKHAYVPPEQFRGKAVEASDIYAMGATLYFLSTGHDPEPITQSSLKSLTRLDEIIKRSTALNTAKRLASVRELKDLLSGSGGEQAEEIERQAEEIEKPEEQEESAVIKIKLAEEISG